MINYNELPSFIRNSTTLTEQDKLNLCNIEHLPLDSEIDEIRNLNEIRELTNAFIGDESTRDTHLQLKAKEYLAVGDIVMAWKVMLLN